MRQILVTSALVYANGPAHLGHILEQIQTDIWVRFQKLQGNHCLYISGDDTHGTPIMLYAQKQNLTPEELIQQMHAIHERDSAGFLISFDNYGSTNSPLNRELTEQIYQRILQQGDIATETISQAFDEKAQMFLPDRYVKGTCPKCGALDQYGDTCEQCGSTYTPAELVNPRSTVSGEPPIPKDSEHYFFRLDKYTDFLRLWTKEHLQSEMTNKLNEWLNHDLKRWDISRDAPYFGFTIPGAPQKFFYVWLDAPIGYLASLKEFIAQHQELNFDDYFAPHAQTELYHFIGKDIVYFHTLFWPAILKSAGLRQPTSVFAHGYLTVNGEKMSKSRGTFILAQQYLKYLEPEYLRYYFATKLTASFDDIDLNFAEFIQKNNSDLVGKVVNIASRSANFINKNFAGKLAATLDQPELFAKACASVPEITAAYEARNFSLATKLIMGIADLANHYIDEQKPWAIAKINPNDPQVQSIATLGLNFYRLLILLLKPIVPQLAAKSEAFLQIPPLVWDDATKPLLNHTINQFNPLLARVDPRMVEKLLNEE